MKPDRLSVSTRTDEPAEKFPRFLDRVEVNAAKREIHRIAEAPRLDHHIIHVDHHRDDHADDAKIFSPTAADEKMKCTRRCVETMPACHPAHRPLGPANRQPDHKKRQEIRDHECPAAVLSGLTGETQKIPKAHGASRHGHNHSQS